MNRATRAVAAAGALRAHLATVLIAVATVAAAGVLAVVALHVLAN